MGSSEGFYIWGWSGGAMVLGKLPVPGLVGCFGLNGPLRQYFSLYRAVSKRGRERRKDR